MKKMINIISLFCFLFVADYTKAQSCIDCSIQELYIEVSKVDNFFDVDVENNTDGYKYYTSNKKYPVERIWRVKNDTIVAYTVIINENDDYVNSVNNYLTKKYNKVNDFLWVILDDQIQIELHSLENKWFYLYTKVNGK